MGEVRDRARLGHPVALAHGRAEPLRRALGGVGVERRRAGDHDAQREVAPLDARRLGEAEHDRRRDVGARDPMRLEQVEERAEVEARHRHDRRPLRQAEVDHHGLAVDVEERQRADQHVVGADPVDGADLLHVRDEVAMGQHHALRQAGRAARERQHRDVGAGIDGGGAGVAGVGRQRLEREDAVQLGLAQGAAQRLGHDHRARARGRAAAPTSCGVSSGFSGVTSAPSDDDRVERDRPGRRIGAEQADGVPGPDPLGGKPGRDARDLVGELGVGRDRAARPVDQRRLVTARGRAGDDVLRQRDLRNVDVGVRAAHGGHARDSTRGGGVETTYIGSDGGSPDSSNVPSDSSSTPSTMWRTETARYSCRSAGACRRAR